MARWGGVGSAGAVDVAVARTHLERAAARLQYSFALYLSFEGSSARHSVYALMASAHCAAVGTRHGSRRAGSEATVRHTGTTLLHLQGMQHVVARTLERVVAGQLAPLQLPDHADVVRALVVVGVAPQRLLQVLDGRRELALQVQATGAQVQQLAVARVLREYVRRQCVTVEAQGGPAGVSYARAATGRTGVSERAPTRTQCRSRPCPLDSG